jgi:DNA-binding transcriptional MerR regulator
VVGDGTLRIGDLAGATGVSVSTIRSWEQRYGLLRPTRTVGGHRAYVPGDVGRVRAVQALVAAGLTVAAAAARVGAGATEPVVEPSPVPEEAGRGTSDTVDAEALAVVHTATRGLLRATTAAEVVDVLLDATRALGGDVVAPVEGDGRALPLDLSFGELDPLLPAADPDSAARLRLEQRLPPLVEDARLAITRIRRSNVYRRPSP